MRIVTRTCFLLGAAAAMQLVQVAAATTPFRGKLHVLPGLIEAEDFDEGPAGEAYRDRDPVNHGADYRGTTEVDIEPRSDASNGYGVGWTHGGEWLVYSVEITAAGEYLVEIPVASQKRGGVLHLELDGRDITGPIRVPDTGSWQKLRRIFVRTMPLPVGGGILKLTCDEDGPSGSVADIDYLKFSKAIDNQLTQGEQAEGWRLLFNGRDYDGWRCNNGKTVASDVEDGCLVPHKSGGYLVVYDRPFGDFILKCDVRLDTDDSNSGIFFRVENLKNPVHTGLEVQVLGGEGVGKSSFGAICDLSATTRRVSRKSGKWNQVELRCAGPKIDVWVNGQVASTLNCDAFSEPGECPDGTRHKFVLEGMPRAVKDFSRRGYLGFQDHGDKVWYKNIKVLEL